MALDPVDLLLEELVVASRGKWPPPRELRVADSVRTWRAFLETDRDALKVIAGWTSDRDYKADPLPALIADAWADHVFGEAVEVTAAAEGDAAVLAALLEGNGDLLGDLHAAERANVAEGEQWWRIYRDEDVADVPLLEWHSRDAVIPLFVGRRLLAAAIVTELEPLAKARKAVYRHLEVHVEGAVEHVLFRGTKTRIGATVPLETHPELVELAAALGASGGEGQRWEHGLPALAGRVTNGRGIDRRLGVGISDYARISDQLLDLNEASTIGAENARLTAKRRVIVPEESLAPRGPELRDRGDGSFERVQRSGFDAGEDVLVVSKLDAELGSSSDGPFKVLEYAFDAEALITYKRDLVETALTRIGLTPSYVGVDTRSSMGAAISGTARRLMLTPTTNAGRGKARPWDDALPQIIGLMARLDALGVDAGGFDRSWADPLTTPAVERANAVPADEVEESQVESTLISAGARSIRTSVARQHPEWSKEQIDEELEAIRADRAAGSAGSAFGGFGGGPA